MIINIEEKFNEKYKRNLNLLDEFINNDKINKINDLKFFLNEKINEKKNKLILISDFNSQSFVEMLSEKMDQHGFKIKMHLLIRFIQI